MQCMQPAQGHVPIKARDNNKALHFLCAILLSMLSKQGSYHHLTTQPQVVLHASDSGSDSATQSASMPEKI